MGLVSCITSWQCAAAVRGLAWVAVANLIDGDDPEAVGTVGVETQLHVVEVTRYSLPLLPPPLLLLCVLLLTGLHDELCQSDMIVLVLPVQCLVQLLETHEARRACSVFPHL